MRACLPCLGFVLAASCHGSGSGTAAATADFAVAAYTQGNFAWLDDPITVVFTAGLDADTANAQSVRITATAGPGVGSAPRGSFSVEDGAVARDTLRFWPQLPLDDALATGLVAGTTYQVTLAGISTTDLVPLRDRAGRPLRTGLAFTVTMPAAGRFRPAAAGPRVIAATASPLDEHGRWLPGAFPSGPTELRLRFDTALDPTDDNLPRLPTAMARGPLQLVYDDPEYGPDSWIPIRVELLANTRQFAEVALRPIGVLPTAAHVRALMASGLRTLGGQSDTGPGHEPLVATADTLADYRPRFDALAARFTAEAIDPEGGFGEPMAEVEGGTLSSAAPPFGAGSGFDWQPQQAETIVDTDGIEWVPSNGPVQVPADGIVRVRNFHLPAGRSLRGIGSRPLVFVCDGDFVVDGELSVAGGNAGAHGIHQAYRGPGDVPPPNPGSGGGTGTGTGGDPLLSRSTGGIGVCGGGHGGRRGPPPGVNARAETGRPGFGPYNVAGGGGQPGRLACTAGCGRGSGGGGGGMATQGDPWFPATGSAAPTSFQQRRGVGGQGCNGASGAVTRVVDGGPAGPVAFTDARADNDFWGVGFDVHRQLRIAGELAWPQGGGGGAGGGDLSAAGGCSLSEPNFVNDEWGGDGGGGGGVVIVQASGRIVVGPVGHIRADGGNGNGGDQASSSNLGGGGGGGAGGMVVLMSSDRIVLHCHGETFANRDYDFAISCDGGVCRTGTFSTPVIAGKYPANGMPVVAGNAYDNAPLGGFGGMGVIQLQAPLGSDNRDGTNTLLDDAILVIDGAGQPLAGADKQRFLGWRGIADGSGATVDDFGAPIPPTNLEGDLRPAPVLLPAPFGSTSRARSRWLGLGAVPRRPLTGPDGAARGVVISANNRGPEFPGQRLQDGWLPWRESAAGLVADADAELAAPVSVLAATAVELHGRAAYRLDLGASLGAGDDRYAGYLAELLGPSGELQRRLRIRASSGSTLWLDADDTLPPRLTSLQVRSWFATADFSGSPTPASYTGSHGALVPQSNVRFGFAFHRDPGHAAAGGVDADRLPHQVGTFFTDLQDPAVQRELLGFGATHVMSDVTLEQAYRREAADQPAAWNLHTPPLRLQQLLLPFRY